MCLNIYNTLVPSMIELKFQVQVDISPKSENIEKST